MYKIEIENGAAHPANPLLALAGREFASYEAACNGIYDALYEVIDGEVGLEALPRSADMTPAENDEYLDDCLAYILHNGFATEDGVIARVVHDLSGVISRVDHDLSK